MTSTAPTNVAQISGVLPEVSSASSQLGWCTVRARPHVWCFRKTNITSPLANPPRRSPPESFVFTSTPFPSSLRTRCRSAECAACERMNVLKKG